MLEIENGSTLLVRIVSAENCFRPHNDPQNVLRATGYLPSDLLKVERKLELRSIERKGRLGIVLLQFLLPDSYSWRQSLERLRLLVSSRLLSRVRPVPAHEGLSPVFDDSYRRFHPEK